MEGQQQHADALHKARDAAEQDKQRFVERTDRVLIPDSLCMVAVASFAQ